MSIQSRLVWLTAVRGIASLALGLIALTHPWITVIATLIFLGAFLSVDGICALADSLRLAQHRRLQQTLLVKGVLSLLVGMAFFVWPHATLLVMLYSFAVWAVLAGVLEIIAAVELRILMDYHGWLGVIGVISLLFGLLLFVHPYATLTGFVQAAGFYALLCGGLLLILAAKIYSRSRRVLTGMLP